VVSLEARSRDDDGGGSFNAPAGGFGGEPVRPTRSSTPSDDELDDLPF
jgi:hypothetical protein